MDIAQFVTLLLTSCFGFGALFNRVAQLEKRIDGNGISIPGRCDVHAERLNEHAKAIDKLTVVFTQGAYRPPRIDENPED